jgi:hypothetical protein
MCRQVHCAELEVIRIWTLHDFRFVIIVGGGAPAPPLKWASAEAAHHTDHSRPFRRRRDLIRIKKI